MNSRYGKLEIIKLDDILETLISMRGSKSKITVLEMISIINKLKKEELK